jgi:hypothetical protein
MDNPSSVKDHKYQSRSKVLRTQRKEIIEYLVYRALFRSGKDEHNKEILEAMANDGLEDSV